MTTRDLGLGACPKCSRDTISRLPSGECYFGCAAPDDDDARVERHWSTQGPDGAGKAALRVLLADVRADERRQIVDWLRSPGAEPGLCMVAAQIANGDHMATHRVGTVEGLK